MPHHLLSYCSYDIYTFTSSIGAELKQPISCIHWGKVCQAKIVTLVGLSATIVLPAKLAVGALATYIKANMPFSQNALLLLNNYTLILYLQRSENSSWKRLAYSND